MMKAHSIGRAEGLEKRLASYGAMAAAVVASGVGAPSAEAGLVVFDVPDTSTGVNGSVYWNMQTPIPQVSNSVFSSAQFQLQHMVSSFGTLNYLYAKGLKDNAMFLSAGFGSFVQKLQTSFNVGAGNFLTSGTLAKSVFETFMSPFGFAQYQTGPWARAFSWFL